MKLHCHCLLLIAEESTFVLSSSQLNMCLSNVFFTHFYYYYSVPFFTKTTRAAKQQVGKRETSSLAIKLLLLCSRQHCYQRSTIGQEDSTALGEPSCKQPKRSKAQIMECGEDCFTLDGIGSCLRAMKGGGGGEVRGLLTLSERSRLRATAATTVQ